MTHTVRQDLQDDPIHVQAAEWLTRLQDPYLSLEEALEWQRWVGSDPRHQQAFARMEAVWEQPWELMRESKPSRRRASTARLAVAASVVLIAATALIGSIAWLFRGAAGIDTVQTAVGENKTLVLADGSRVILGGGTELTAAFDAHTRSLELKRGEAYFKVAKEPHRPFSVHAGEAIVTAVGTEFNVRRGSDRVVVAVVEGRVVVEPTPLPKPIAWLSKSAPNRQPAPLSAGEETIVQEDGIAATSRMTDLAAATGWQTGQLAFRQEPLKYVLEDVNRYAPKPIVLGDESLGDMRVTGTLIGGSVAGWVQGLESAFDLNAREENGRIVLERNQ